MKPLFNIKKLARIELTEGQQKELEPIIEKWLKLESTDDEPSAVIAQVVLQEDFLGNISADYLEVAILEYRQIELIEKAMELEAQA